MSRLNKTIRLLIVALSLLIGGLIFSHLAQGQGIVCSGIKLLQPATTNDRASKLSKIFKKVGKDTDIDPLLLVAISFRESSLSKRVEDHTIMGKRNEIGLMQIMPKSPAMQLRPNECTQKLNGPYCQIATGAKWLAKVRELCPGSWWRWVGSYGHKKCLSENRAGMDYGTRIAKRYYEKIGGKGWR